MINKNFAIFILAHGRPDKCITPARLRRAGYTGNIYIILDNEDDTVDKYKEKFGEENCIIFDKAKVAEKFDIYDNFDGRNVVVFARNVCFDIARELGLDYFAEFEDDYREFNFRVPVNNNTSLRTIWIQDFDSVCEAMLDFIDSTGIRTAAFAQTGEMIGGIKGSVWQSKVKRKAMNTFFFKVGKPEEDMYFLGRFNDDVNVYTLLGSRGEIFIQTPVVNVTQQVTQGTKGGNTDAYLKYGTYAKSFYSLLSCPSCVKIYTIADVRLSGNGGDHRFHHSINWEHCVPKIVSDKFKEE